MIAFPLYSRHLQLEEHKMQEKTGDSLLIQVGILKKKTTASVWLAQASKVIQAIQVLMMTNQELLS
jgi:hypothetical protein